jgi:ATP-dependent DNA ligase
MLMNQFCHSGPLTQLFNATCGRDLEGIVRKWREGRYETDGASTSWLKVKNPQYSQMVGRREVFEARRDRRQSRRRDWSAPVLRLQPQPAGPR